MGSDAGLFCESTWGWLFCLLHYNNVLFTRRKIVCSFQPCYSGRHQRPCIQNMGLRKIWLVGRKWENPSKRLRNANWCRRCSLGVNSSCSVFIWYLTCDRSQVRTSQVRNEGVGAAVYSLGKIFCMRFWIFEAVWKICPLAAKQPFFGGPYFGFTAVVWSILIERLPK